ncbi:UTP20 [Candida margitis]|uniref:UTP20 n=1 Tax=Candida margitis TaxID=1775924 RepID=UPI002226668D|nr:UTP20 [Candida margitis]KAI5966086.1 UTP20 [Candida margitis]
MPKNRTTESSRRHAFISFRERVDSIKIEPSKRLDRRVHDEVESSHLLTTLEHWNELNLSGTFTDLSSNIANYCQSLPQVLHHKQRIYDSIYEAIQQNDIHSLQPSLELLSQFIHDLGPDFLPFYKQTLQLLVEVVLMQSPNDIQNNRNTSNALNWIFTTLAFAFKYLVKILTQDLQPTFSGLLPLLTLTNRAYISRFCAEALSYLVRKSSADVLRKFIHYAIYEHVNTLVSNDHYGESLKILFSESMKSTRGSFHTKSKTILTILMECIISEIKEKYQPQVTSLVSDILLDVLHHGEADACQAFYKLVSEAVHDVIQSNCSDLTLLMSSQLLSTLCFADSGKKVTDWSCVLNVVDEIVEAVEHRKETSLELNESLVYLMTIIFRNVNIQSLVSHYQRYFDAMYNLNRGLTFLSFVYAGLAIAGGKLKNFGIDKYIQMYINNASTADKLQMIVLFLEKSEKSDQSKFTIPDHILEAQSQHVAQGTESGDYQSVYWRLLVVKFTTKRAIDASVLIKLIKSAPDSVIGREIVALSVELLAPQLEKSLSVTQELSAHILQSFGKFSRSLNFLPAMTQLLKVVDEPQKFLDPAIECLLLPSHKTRSHSMDLIESILAIEQKPISPIFSQIKLIEQIPLSIETGRDIMLRVRNLASELSKEINPSQFDKTVTINFLFGLLSNKFQPSWKAVFEAVPLLASTCKGEIWKTSFVFLTMDYEPREESYDFSSELTSNLISWQPRNHRLYQNFEQFENKSLAYFRNVNNSIYDLAQDAYQQNEFEGLIRSNTLQALQSAPSVVNASKLADFLLNDKQNGIYQNWSKNDKNAYLALLSKVKNLKKIDGCDNLFKYMLDLLTSTYTKVQSLSLDVIFAFNDPIINKHKDVLKNLLDDVTFSDELSKFTSVDCPIESEAKQHIMPLVIRILFGKFQGKPASKSKQGGKNAVLLSLPNFTDDEIVSFIEIGANKISYKDYFEKRVSSVSLGLDDGELKRITGFINLLQQVYEVFKKNHAFVLATTIEPLIYSLLCAQNRIDCKVEGEDPVSDKMARNIRSGGMRNLKELFRILGPQFNWKQYVGVVSDDLIAPRLPKFANENLQQPSAVLTLMCFWIQSPNTLPLLFANDFEAVKAILSLLERPEAKEAVISVVLDFAVTALEKKDDSEESYFTLLAIVVDSLLQTLSSTINRILEPEVGSKAIKTLLLMIQGDYIDTKETKSALIQSLTFALERNNQQIDVSDKSNVLIALSSLMASYDCTFEEILPLYLACAKLLRVVPVKEVRETLATLFGVLGTKFEQLQVVSQIITGLNAYTSRMNEYDFEKRLEAYRLVNEELYPSFDPVQWVPLLNNALFNINDPTELAIRVNAGYLLRRFVDCYTSKTSANEAVPYIHLLKDTILPIVRIGIRKENEDVQTEYVAVLEYIVKCDKYFPDLKDLQVLIGEEEDEESQFFRNINHIQLHLRQKSIRRLGQFSDSLSGSNVSHYILPLLEKYTISKEEKYRNIGLEALDSIKVLVRSINWNQYKAILKRYLAGLEMDSEVLRQRVNLVVAVSSVLKDHKENGTLSNVASREEIDAFLIGDVLSQITKILQVRDDDTIVARAPLAEAAINLILSLSGDKVEGALPSVLTSMCQVMRSRSEELRDAVRKTLGRITIALGANYFSFIIRELKTALSRGSQIHVLSFTVHYLLQCLSNVLKHGDLDESISLTIDIAMEDIFGAAGQEKDADGYTSKMKEVKFKKSFDTCEILASNISLTNFGELVTPIKLLLQETINHRVQVQLDEVLRKLSLGLNHNTEASSQNILHLCYEIFMMSNEADPNQKVTKISESEQHFLTTLSRKTKSHVDRSVYKQTMQKLSLELLRTAISRHESLLTTSNLKGFVTLLATGINSEGEGVVLASLKVLTIIIRLPFDEESQGILKACVRKALLLIKDSPTTNSDVCQAALKFLATTIKHNPKVVLKDSAISYVLTRIQPDLEEPNRQGLAFQFLKAIVSQHLLLPEIYDVMDSVAKLMIVNHSKEIRDMSRSIYFQFLMEYDQGKGKLEKSFKFLVNNLTYPTEEGRQSVMELIHLIILKAGPDLLEKLASSFFIALANILVSDDSSRCREMANALLTSMMKKLNNADFIEKYCSAWLSQSSNVLLKRCGFQVYKMLITVFGMKQFPNLNKLVLDNISKILADSKYNEEGNSVDWELLYSSLSVFGAITSCVKDQIYEQKYVALWDSVIDCLLYPHSWIRLITCRLVSVLLSNLDKSKLDNNKLELIATKLIHQLRTPSLTDELGTLCIKNLTFIAVKWETTNAHLKGAASGDDNGEVQYANDFLIKRVCGIIKQENQSMLAKKMAIKFLILFIQLTKEDRMIEVSEKIIDSLYNFTDEEYCRSLSDDELTNMSLQALNMVKEKIGTTEYTRLFAKVRQQVDTRRKTRKAKRSQMAVTAPEIAAKRKFKKHERVREKRKHEKDENGYYKPKKKRVR